MQLEEPLEEHHEELRSEEQVEQSVEVEARAQRVSKPVWVQLLEVVLEPSQEEGQLGKAEGQTVHQEGRSRPNQTQVGETLFNWKENCIEHGGKKRSVFELERCESFEEVQENEKKNV